MKGDVIPDADHICRLCGGSHIREDGTIAASAFKPRPGEAYLSVNWLEILNAIDPDEAIAKVQRVLAKKRKIGASARWAILNVGQARSVVAPGSQARSQLSAVHEPELQDPSHSGLYGVPEDDNMIPELLAQAISGIVPAR